MISKIHLILPNAYKLVCFDRNINGNRDVEFLEWDYLLLQRCVKLTLDNATTSRGQSQISFWFWKWRKIKVKAERSQKRISLAKNYFLLFFHNFVTLKAQLVSSSLEKTNTVRTSQLLFTWSYSSSKQSCWGCSTY